ncbi:hypothetical protein C8A03DRAFT_12898 [Achaetomium macrosporum]|uniref:Uncharacterized protein n=1 Tax=Achaetomium macrosporum TaxID=79813 RepID=A0AAN7HG86_9PEZI|nr:hypothetical protein C8A03DRAFT_12898 [Achaetomium macrosporum]
MAAVAPMDLVVKGEAASIPLKCTLCPKKPNFSDLSHLLTHISSKSHLAHRFKAELKARDNEEAQDEVRQYDQWCERYGINGLLAERMAAKEQKKAGRRGGRQSNIARNNKPGVGASHQDLIKPDPEGYGEHPSAMGHWPAETVSFQDGRHGHFDNAGYGTPNMKRSLSDGSTPITPENEIRARYYRSTEFFDDDTDINKLKGVKYPGMGLFDSADETQKRMRNQRKDDSVLKQMEETSYGIEPNEIIWENGEFQRIRDIYATPSIEGSPDRTFEEDDAPKPKRTRRATAAAAPMRASARIARQRASRNKSNRGENDNDSNRLVRSIEGFDVFRDPPKPSSDRDESPPKESGFELHRRPALQNMNSNLSMGSSALKAEKPVSYISARGSGTASFTSQPPVSNSHYFQHQHAMGTGTMNPLCVQARGGFYGSYGFSNYGNEPKSSTTNFQALGSMDLGDMSFNGYGGPYAPPGSIHDRVDQDFDL